MKKRDNKSFMRVERVLSLENSYTASKILIYWKLGHKTPLKIAEDISHTSIVKL